MAATADPTNEEFHAQLQRNTGRISAAQREILRRLQANMPAKIAYLNDVLNRPEGRGIPAPSSYLPAPGAQLGDHYLNAMLCGVKVTTAANGVGSFKSTAEVAVYSVDRRVDHPTQVEDAFDRASVAIGILLHFLNGCTDPEGRRVWRALEPAGHALTLPQLWAGNYSGSTAWFTLIQDQSCNCWI